MAQAWRDGAWAAGAWAEGAWAQSGAEPVITTTSLPGGQQNVPYSFQLTASGDVPITWTLSGGALPTGLSLASSGAITGIPTTLETTNPEFTATNAQGNDVVTFSMTIGTAATGTGAERATRGTRMGRGMMRLVGR